MKSILVDTNAYSAFKRGEPDALEIVNSADSVAISVVVLGELLAGFRFDIWIAATAVQHHLTLFSFDTHFARVSGLTVGRVPLDFGL